MTIAGCGPQMGAPAGEGVEHGGGTTHGDGQPEGTAPLAVNGHTVGSGDGDWQTYVGGKHAGIVFTHGGGDGHGEIVPRGVGEGIGVPQNGTGSGHMVPGGQGVAGGGHGEIVARGVGVGEGLGVALGTAVAHMTTPVGVAHSAVGGQLGGGTHGIDVPDDGAAVGGGVGVGVALPGEVVGAGVPALVGACVGNEIGAPGSPKPPGAPVHAAVVRSARPKAAPNNRLAMKESSSNIAKA